MSRLASECAQLRPVLDAFRRGTKRSRLRLLVVVCPNGHTLVEVFPTSGGPVALWSRREKHDATDPRVDDRWEDVWEAEPLTNAWAIPALAACGCHDNLDIDLTWVHRQLDAGQRRVLAPGLESARHVEEVDGISIVWD